MGKVLDYMEIELSVAKSLASVEIDVKPATVGIDGKKDSNLADLVFSTEDQCVILHVDRANMVKIYNTIFDHLKLDSKPYACPECGKALESVKFTEHGHIELVDGQWKNTWPYSEASFWCTNCQRQLDFESLTQAGVV